MAETNKVLEVLLPEIRSVREAGERGLRELGEAVGELHGRLREQGALLRQLHRSDELQAGSIEKLRQEIARSKERPSASRWYAVAVLALVGALLAVLTGDTGLLERILAAL